VFTVYQHNYQIPDFGPAEYSDKDFDGPPSFVSEYLDETHSNLEKMISLTYFAFTTLSTVGLGDLHPISSTERVFGAFVMLFGVSITSFVMENFSVMLG